MDSFAYPCKLTKLFELEFPKSAAKGPFSLEILSFKPHTFRTISLRRLQESKSQATYINLNKLVVGDPNGILVLSLQYCLVSEEFGYKVWGDFSFIALYYGKIFGLFF